LEVWRVQVIRGLAPIGRLEPPLRRTVEQKLDETLISAFASASQKVFASIQAFNLKLFAGLDAVLVPNFGGNDNLALARDRCLHLM
jgi:hypothetical protein